MSNRVVLLGTFTKIYLCRGITRDCKREKNMITINKNADNNFRVEYINEKGIANGWASVVFNTKELKTLIELSDMYFRDLYAKKPELCGSAICTATQAMIKTNIDNFDGSEFDYSSDSVNKAAAASAIYTNLTSKVIKEFKAEVA